MAARYRDARSENFREVDLLDDLGVRLRPGARILDAGCGSGTPGLRRADGGRGVVGLDFSREQLRLARDAAPGAALAQGDVTALPFGDGAFDAVCAFHSVIHVPTDEHPAVLREFARALRSGGWLLFSTGEGAWEGSNPDWLGGGVEMRWSFPGLDATLDALSEAGFAVETRRIVEDELGDDGGAFTFVLARPE